MRWIVVGDSKEYGYKECLMYVCFSREAAEEKAEQARNDPDEIAMRHTNIKAKCVPDTGCWWLNGTD